MSFIPTHTSAFSASREHRLCWRDAPEQLKNAAQSLNAGNEILSNPALKDVLDQYSRLIALSHNNLANAVDRAYFFSLLFNQALPADWSFEDGYAILTKDKLQLPQPPESAIQKYINVKNILVASLRKNGIAEVTFENGTPLARGERLSRDEFLALLKLVWDGRQKDVDDHANQGLAGVRTLIQEDSSLKQYRRITGIYTDLTFEEVGPAETLRRFGIDLGQDLRRDYLQQRRGASHGKYMPGNRPLIPVAYQVPGMPGGIPSGAPQDSTQPLELQPGESAVEWERSPKRALLFLEKRMPQTPANARFLVALRWYVEHGWQELPSAEREKLVYGISTKSVRAILHLITQSLLESETVVSQSWQQREQIRSDKNVFEKMEAEIPKIWNYMTKDIGKHPIGSIIAWGAAIIAVKSVWNFITSEHKRWFNLLWIGALGGVGLGMYQKHQNGVAWWEGMGDTISKWAGKERELPPDQQTLPNYWKQKLDISSEHERYALVLLQDQPVGRVLDWYGAMDQWRIAGMDPRKQPRLFLNVQDHRKLFGGKNDQEIGSIFFETLRRFFDDRGRVARKEQIPFVSTVEVRDDASLGYAYIKEKYLERTWFKKMVLGAVQVGSVKIGESEMKKWHSKDPELLKKKAEIKKLNPEILATLDQVYLGYFSETYIRYSANWDMWNIFMLEADPEILRRMSLSGRVPASVLDKIWEGVKGFSADVIDIDGKPFTLLQRAGKWFARNLQGVFDYVWNPISKKWDSLKGGKSIDGPPPPDLPPSHVVPPAPVLGPPSVVPPAPQLTPAVVAPDVVLPPGLVPGPGIVLPPKTVLPPGTQLPPTVVPPGIVLPPAKIDPNIVLPPGFIIAPGLVLPAGAVIPVGTVIPPATLRQAPIIAPNVSIHPGIVVPHGTVLPTGTVLPQGTVLPPDSVPSGTVLPVASIDPSVKLPTNFVPPPGLVLPAGAVIPDGTVIPPPYVQK